MRPVQSQTIMRISAVCSRATLFTTSSLKHLFALCVNYGTTLRRSNSIIRREASQKNQFPFLFSRAVDPSTIRSRLRQSRLKARRPYKGPILTRNHRNARMQWARAHSRWTRRQWGTTLFSDESKFNVSEADGRKRVWRRRGERYDDNCVIEHNRWGGGGVMVWGGISAFGKTDLVVFAGNVNAVTYRDTVLAPVVVPYMRRHLRRGLFQQDNARPHTARLTLDFLRTSGINIMDWPVCRYVPNRAHLGRVGQACQKQTSPTRQCCSASSGPD